MGRFFGFTMPMSEATSIGHLDVCLRPQKDPVEYRNQPEPDIAQVLARYLTKKGGNENGILVSFEKYFF